MRGIEKQCEIERYSERKTLRLKDRDNERENESDRNSFSRSERD